MSYAITVCIPIFNQHIAGLAEVLVQQASAASLPVEVYFADDASEDKFKNENRLVVDRYDFKYEEMPRNKGRAGIRNHMADNATTSHIIFLDGDTIIEHPDFIVNYIEAMLLSPETVFCGGTYFQPINQDKNTMLHWTYGTKVIAELHSRRDLEGRFHFMSSNFLIKRAYFDHIRFHEELKDYGHEDTVFGYELRAANVEIEGIDNQILHGSLDANEEFLAKVSHMILNLKKLKKSGRFDEALEDIRLVRAARNVQRFGMRSMFLWFFDSINAPVSRNLNGPKPSLTLLNMFKLYLFLKN